MFKAALFDMDGTLLDSMNVWTAVDTEFFRVRDIPVPDDYGPALAGKTFKESAEYTKERFCLPESVEEIIEEWNALCRSEYAHHVRLKPGARDYLRLLRRGGVKICAATALPEHLFLPALRNNRVDDLFDAFASTEETGSGKQTGDVYRLAARKLGVDPADCVVFEDILEGATGAHAAGMRACNVYDRAADHNRAAINAAFDFTIADFTDVSCLPAVRPAWERAVIVSAYAEGPFPKDALRPSDLVIAADRGAMICRENGITPGLCIGDFDSLLPGETVPEGAVVLPREKDDTDTLAAVKKALSLGAEELLLIGGLGGRLDHTLANLQCVRYAHERSAELVIRDAVNTAQPLGPGVHILPGDTGRFSLLAFGREVTGVSVMGAKYALSDGTLTDDFPLGISNETIPGRDTVIAVGSGLLLLIVSAAK